MTQPFFEKAPSILNKPDGSVLFECMCNANPQPDIKWYFKEKELPPDDRHIMKIKKMVGKFAVTMEIKSPQSGDQGIYKVEASNKHGKHQTEQGYVMVCTADSMYK